MVFSSVVFLFLFLPLVLAVNAFSPKYFRNSFLLLASLLFYFWGEMELIFVIIISILINYIIGIAVDKVRSKAKLILITGVLANFLMLFYYKYFQFFLDNINGVFGYEGNEMLVLEGVRLPMGISFFTFQGVSYVIDVYRKEAKAELNPINIGLYVALFPQLIAGPIVRYNTIMDQIKDRTTSFEKVYEGVLRFAIGFSKKIIIANSLAQVADSIFAIEIDTISSPLAWLGIICYALQIFFDFSGYSDMAIGLGKILGFDFEENFNFPYISKSIKEFWRRWHISLSTWFRDYLYIPLGGSRKGNLRTYFNLFIVFLATGIWHGASWSFVFWGLFHGGFLILEKLGLDNYLKKLYAPFQHLYVLILVLIGWVYFRVEDFSDASSYVFSMFSFKGMESFLWDDYMNNYTTFTLLIGLLLSINLNEKVLIYENKLNLLNIKLYKKTKIRLFLLVVFIAFYFSVSEIANNTYNPFIYFRF